LLHCRSKSIECGAGRRDDIFDISHLESPPVELEKLVEDVVEMVDGDIGGGNEAPKGSRLWIGLPFERYVIPIEDVAITTFAQWRVLIVDDIAMNQGILRIPRAPRCWGAGESDNGPAVLVELAAGSARREDYDLVPLDCISRIMPGGCGARPAASSAAPLSGDDNGARRPILIVEDDKMSEVLARRLLEGEGHTVAVAENGQEALDIVARDEFALILMDLHMPVMDGIEATRHIRALDGAKARVPIIAMTADAMEDARERFLAAGINDYIGKPIDPELFRTVVARWLAQASPAPSRTSETDDDPFFAALRDEYRARLLGDAARLEELWSAFAATADHSRRGVLAGEMMRLTHGLSGSAASFGFAAIGTAARPLDVDIAATIADRTAFSPAAGTGAEWAAPIARLVALCRAAAARRSDAD
jgi:CheY-like chemotaxis protein